MNSMGCWIRTEGVEVGGVVGGRNARSLRIECEEETNERGVIVRTFRMLLLLALRQVASHVHLVGSWPTITVQTFLSVHKTVSPAFHCLIPVRVVGNG